MTLQNKYMSSIRSAMYDIPTNYTENERYYEGTLQDKINETFEFASDVFKIGEEKVFGTLEFSPVMCRVNHAIEPKTGLNLGDDFKELRFADLSAKRYMGQRYRFDNSIWLTVNTDNYHYITKSAIIRRYNNELRWIDMDTKKLISEPCIVDYAIKYANLYFNNTVDIPQGTLVVITQYNENTKKIKINDRFILGSHAYKIKTILDALRSETYNQDTVPLITFQVYVDTIAHDDNFMEGLGQYNPLYPENLANVGKYEEIFNPSITGNENVIIEPETSTIMLNESVEYSCYLEVDGKRSDVEFDFQFSGVPSTYYVATAIDGNHFKIFNKKTNLKNKLKVICQSKTGNCKKEMLVELGGMF